MKKVLIIIIVLIFLWSCIVCIRNVEYTQYKEHGKVLIDKIEIYLLENKRLPNSITEIGFNENMEMGPYYYKIDCNEYSVYYCIGFDEYYVYNSLTKEWKYQTSVIH